MKRFTKSMIVALAMSIATPAFAASPFSDVPQGHWAYKAVERAVETGLLSAHDGKFKGDKTMTRYQMAVVVARMLDRIEPAGGKHSKKDIENLEALVIEFADELALLHVKVSTLEDGFADMKKDVDGLKKEMAAGGNKAGISGMMQARLAVTDSDPTAFQGRGAAPAATNPIARFVGRVPAGSVIGAAGARGSSRTFFNIAQTSIGFDRHFDDDYYLHLQLDIDADQEAAFATGASIQVNEAFVDAEKWLWDGDVRVRMGTYALPFSRERNPEMADYPNQLRFGYRTLDLTISPSYQDQAWEAVRNVGLSLWQGKGHDLKWQVGVTNSPFSGTSRDGSLLAWKQFTGATQFGDSLHSINNNGTGAAGSQDKIGAYGWAGEKYAGGFRWDAGYFTSGGSVRADGGTSNAWSGGQLNLGWWGWEDWGFMGSFYASSSDSATNAAGTIFGGAASYMAPGALITAFLPAGTKYPSLDSQAFSLLVNYKFSDDNNASVRYEDLRDEFGPAEITGQVVTASWNHHVSPNSMLQLEYSAPTTKTRTAGAVGTALVAGAKNNVDVDDNLIQLNYKVRF
ncbi:MAG: S-layer homology domain-containing protein [Candidatus Wallbacteria bacterium]|nr:S-layer homology domain-containing protein [Candidatus Wallbacteria bacterium]